MKKSHITSSKVYLILDRLEQKGLAFHIVKNNVKYFQATDPAKLLDYMEEKKKELEKDKEQLQRLIPELKLKREQFHELQETSIYQGFRGFQAVLADFISDLSQGDEYVVFGAMAPFGKRFERLLENFYNEKEKRGIKTRIIYNSGFKEAMKLYKPFKLTKLRFVEHILPSTIAVQKEKVMIVTYGEEPRQVLIKSKQIADSFYHFFESMWAIAKP